MDEPDSPLSVLHLPDPCIFKVLQCCAVDPRSIFSAARAHSRLHNIAVLAINSITAPVQQLQQDTSLLPYLSRHGQHVSNIVMGFTRPSFNMLWNGFDSNEEDDVHLALDHLPPLHNLTSLACHHMLVQLQPGRGQRGIIKSLSRAPLKQFHLKECKLLDVTKSKGDAKEEDGAALALAAALSALPHLESLSIDSLRTRNGIMRFRMTVLSKLQQLTSLKITHKAAGL
jgi:hypothetical protein